jgi:glycosyltransferase involved in cell wall biosynthesis
LQPPPDRCLLAFMPCYNESATVATTIQATLDAGVQWVIVADDGSRDDSLEVLTREADRTGRVFVLRLRENRGVAAAKIAGFSLAWLLYRQGLVPATALLAKLDSDGQHDPKYVPAMADELERRGLDMLLSYRDFSVYPFYKVVGNLAVSAFASVLTGQWLRDSMSGLKVLRMPVVGKVLEYFTGYRYAAAQEITMIPCMTGYLLANDYRVDIPIYRSGSGMRDGMSVLRMSVASFLRVRFGQPLDPDRRAREVLSDPNIELVRSPLPVDPAR